MISGKGCERSKNYNRDAIVPARLLRAGELTARYVPDLEDEAEAVRDIGGATRRQNSCT